MWTRKLAVLAGILMVGVTSVAAPAVADRGRGLPLGPRDLPETRTVETLQPGVTLTTILRGEPDPTNGWTVEIGVPAGGNDPDAPPTAIADRQHADELMKVLRDNGFDPRVEEVTTPRVADFAGGTLGFRVRIGHHPDKPAADAVLAAVRQKGFTASTVFTGWDGDPTDRGPWRVQLLTIDPRTFRGDLVGDFGPDLERRETTSALAAARHATAAVNAGFFVLDPAAGAPGDPAGIGIYDGRLLSEATNGRPAFVFDDDARRAGVERHTWRGTVGPMTLDGINRVPGLIRNCGGTPDDLPTSRPLHDTTCTDDAELILFTPAFGDKTPTGPGVEAIVDRHDRVLEIREPRGGPLPAGTRSVQATGTRAAQLTELAQPGRKLKITSDLRGDRADTVVNGGPELVRHGRPHATPAADGMVRPGDPSFYYGWVAKRNPRTIAGVDDHGRILLATIDGRAVDNLGLSIAESAAVAAALGMREAVNLDGGGSTTMVENGQVINDPSDATGERPVGDAILILR